MMLTFRAGKVVALAIYLSALAACSREQQDWRSAEAADTVESYGKFLERHPDSELATAARTRVAQLAEDREWSRAGSADTVQAYREFLAQHPNGKWAQEARIRIQNFALNGLPAAAATVDSHESAGISGAAHTAAAPASTPALASPGEPAQVSVPTSTSLSTAYVSTPRAANGSGDGGGYAVQLGAFGSEAAANNAWQQLTARFGPELQGLSPQVVAANTTGGALFRLQAQVADEPRARALCDMLRKQSQACVPVLPH